MPGIQISDPVGLNGKTPVTDRYVAEVVNADSVPLVKGTLVQTNSNGIVPGEPWNVVRSSTTPNFETVGVVVGSLSIPEGGNLKTVSLAACGVSNTSETVTYTGSQSFLYIGMPISGTSVPSGATITSMTPGTGFTISIAATNTHSSETLTAGIPVSSPPTAIPPTVGTFEYTTQPINVGGVGQVVMLGRASMLCDTTTTVGAPLSPSVTVAGAATLAATTYSITMPSSYTASTTETPINAAIESVQAMVGQVVGVALQAVTISSGTALVECLFRVV